MDAATILRVLIPDTRSLYLAYMPFLDSGGLFIPTNDCYDLGTEVFLLVRLPGEAEELPVIGRVAWFTPGKTCRRSTRGFGLQFREQRPALKYRIEKLLGDSYTGTEPTLTM